MKKHGIMSPPAIYASKTPIITIKKKDLLVFSNLEGIVLHHIEKYVAKVSGYKIVFPPGVDELVQKYCIPVTIFLIILVLLYKIRKFLLHPLCWLFASFIVYIFGCGAIVYSIMKEMPFIGVKYGRYGEILGYDFLAQSVFLL